MRYYIIALLLGWGSVAVVAQEQPATTYVNGLFHGRRIINGHSLELPREGELELYIGHRFGSLNGGGYELFGLDQADMRLCFDYGVKDWLAVGVGRSGYRKTFDGYIKVRLLRQSTGGREMPVSLTALSTMTYEGLRPLDGREIPLVDRLAYTHQLLIGRKFSDRLSVQLMPTLVHKNLVETAADLNDIASLGVAVRYRLSLNVAMTAEYYHTLPFTPLPDGYRNSLALGFDIDTGSHVFQLHFTNSSAMFERAFLTETTGNWLNGGVHLGFNMNRVFKIKGRRF